MCGGSKVEDTDEDKKYGDPAKYDPSFNGPIKNRSCTDVLCCLLFMVFVAGMVGVSILGFLRGNPEKLVFPTDSDGNICGIGDHATKPNLMFFDLLQCARMGPSVILLGCPTPQVCVENCTTDYYVYLESITKELVAGGVLADERAKLLCKYTVNPNTAPSIQTLIDNDDCAAYTVKTTQVVGRCIPSIFGEITDYASNLVTGNGTALVNAAGDGITGQALQTALKYLTDFYNFKQYLELVFKDVVTSWLTILIGLGIALVISLIWIVLLRWIAGIIVWFTIIAVFGVIGFGTYYSYSKYYELKNQNVTATIGLDELFTTNFDYYLSLRQTWLAFGCTAATILVILLLLFIFLVSRICIAIALIKEASRAIGNMLFTLLWPIIPFILEIGVIGYCGASVLYIASMGSAEYKGEATNTTTDGINYLISRLPCDGSNTTANSICEFVKYGGTEYITALEVFMVFMMFWLVNFVAALGQMVLAGAFASHYWAFNKPDDIPAFPLAASMWRAFRYHLGTIAFGSLIIAIIQMIRVLLEYLDYKVKGSENPVAKFLVKCLKCCFWCLEKFMKFLNKNAYIMTAVYGKNFCTSAKNAFFLIMRNIVRIVVLDKITDFVLFLSKLLVTAAIGVAAFFWFQGQIPIFTNYVPSLNYYLTPVICLILGTYVIASCFFSVYSMAVDTLFLCFCEDLERHDGSAEKPYYMNTELMNLLGKKNKKPKK